MTRFRTWVLTWGALAAMGLPYAWSTDTPFLINGSFEAKDEGGWTYLGRNEGSHGVFSEPSRPGTHSYLLQLAGEKTEGFGAITQVLNLEKGAVYRLRFDLWTGGVDARPGAQARQSGSLGDFTLFDRDVCRPSGCSGWTSQSFLFRAPESHPACQFRLTGQAVDREDSTTAIDQVSVETSDALLPPPLLAGKPLAPSRPRSSLPLALGFACAVPSLAHLEDWRNRFGETPALASVCYHWHDHAAPPPWAGLTAWTRHGVVPVMCLPWFPDDLADFPAESSQQRWRQFAKEARRWRYPVILRLAPEMDLQFPAVQAEGFISFWNSVRRIFREEGARNVVWFWTPSRLNAASQAFYPGQDEVDLVGFTLRGQDIPNELRRNVEEAKQRFGSSKRVAVAGSSGPPPSPDVLLACAPKLEFYTVGDFTSNLPVPESPETAGIGKILRHPSAARAIPQTRPPDLQVRLMRSGSWLTAVLRNQDPRRQVSPPSRFRVEIWDGHPFLGGAPVRTYDGVSIRAGQRKTYRQKLHGEAGANAHLLLNLGTDPRFLAAHPDALDWKTDDDFLIVPVPP